MSDLIATITEYAAKRSDMSRPLQEREWFDMLLKNRLDEAYSSGALVPANSADCPVAPLSVETK